LIMLKLCAVSAAAVVCFCAPAYAQATVERENFAFDVENCGVEIVDVAGIVQFNAYATNDDLRTHVRAKGTGKGRETGAAYVWSDTFENFIGNRTPGGTVVASLSVTTALISKGRLPNAVFRINAQFTVTPDGTIVVDRLEANDECDPNGIGLPPDFP
jgi:hypothetical protein